MNKSELFRRACEINQLRRESNLPLRDMRDLIAGEESRLAWAAYTAAVEQYQAVYDQLRDRVRQECIMTGRGDIGLSAGGKWLLNWKAMKLYEEFLETKGYRRPKLKGIPYGPGQHEIT